MGRGEADLAVMGGYGEDNNQETLLDSLLGPRTWDVTVPVALTRVRLLCYSDMGIPCTVPPGRTKERKNCLPTQSQVTCCNHSV